MTVISYETIPTGAGPARVAFTAPDRVRVVLGSARGAGAARYSVDAELFMPEPGVFLDFDRDGEDTVSILPAGTGPSFADIAATAADIAAGVSAAVEVEEVPDDEETLRRTVLSAAGRAYDVMADLAERAAHEDDPAPDEAPSPRM
jgi:hypothetical protein